MTAVLDASAAIAVLKREPGAEAVLARLPGGAICAVNFSEVLAKVLEDGDDPGAARRVHGLGLEVHPFDAARARRAALLRPPTRRLGLSLGDRACLSLGLALGLPVVTADRAWADSTSGSRSNSCGSRRPAGRTTD